MLAKRTAVFRDPGYLTMTGETCDRYWMRPMTQADMSTVSRWFEQLEDLSMFDRRIPLPVNSDAFQAAWRDALAEGEPRTAYWFAVEDAAGEIVGIAGLHDVNYVHGDAVFPAILVVIPIVYRQGVIERVVSDSRQRPVELEAGLVAAVVPHRLEA